MDTNEVWYSPDSLAGFKRDLKACLPDLLEGIPGEVSAYEGIVILAERCGFREIDPGEVQADTISEMRAHISAKYGVAL